MVEFIRKMMSDDNGNPSSTRVMTAFVVINIMLVWTLANLRSDKWIPMDFETIAFLATLLGAKLVQKKLGG